MYNPENIELGEGDCTVQFESESVATDIGACANAEIEIANKYTEVECGQTLDPIEVFLVGRDVKFSIEMIEDTLRNFIIASGGNPSDIDTSNSSYDLYKLSGLSATTTEFLDVIYKVAQVRDKTKFNTFRFPKCKVTGTLKYSFKKDKERMYKVDFKAFADPDNSNSPLIIKKDK